MLEPFKLLTSKPLTARWSFPQLQLRRVLITTNGIALLADIQHHLVRFGIDQVTICLEKCDEVVAVHSLRRPDSLCELVDLTAAWLDVPDSRKHKLVTVLDVRGNVEVKILLGLELHHTRHINSSVVRFPAEDDVRNWWFD